MPPISSRLSGFLTLGFDLLSYLNTDTRLVVDDIFSTFQSCRIQFQTHGINHPAFTARGCFSDVRKGLPLPVAIALDSSAREATERGQEAWGFGTFVEPPLGNSRVGVRWPLSSLMQKRLIRVRGSTDGLGSVLRYRKLRKSNIH